MHMNGIKTSIGEGGRVVLPAAYRKALGVGVGDEVVLTLEDDGLRITTLAKAVERSQALARRYVRGKRSLSRELLRERRREAAND
jgi:AbrB family looped-hinge helix DNA binding protein